jgi:hypothetical protein
MWMIADITSGIRFVLQGKTCIAEVTAELHRTTLQGIQAPHADVTPLTRVLFGRGKREMGSSCQYREESGHETKGIEAQQKW